jgi:hypothetical protein
LSISSRNSNRTNHKTVAAVTGETVSVAAAAVVVVVDVVAVGVEATKRQACMI